MSAQDNMLSDVVTGLRRRPGVELVHATATTGGTKDNILGWSTDIGGQQVKLALNTGAGILRVYSLDWVLLKEFAALPYLQSASRRAIHATTIGDAFVIANTSVKPTLVAGTNGWRTGRAGFIYVKTGAFDTEYIVTVIATTGNFTLNYRTPASSVAGAASASTPQAIAETLVGQIRAQAGWGAVAVGAYLFAYRLADEDVQATFTTPLATAYIGTSNLGYVQAQSDLPARLPEVADGLTIQVGSPRVPTYYRYSYFKSAWLESGTYTSPVGIGNMPVHITRVSGVWTMETGAYEGQLAGDNVSNPAPAFVTRGITGVGSFQGRLVILSGNRVNMSGSTNSKRFFRTSMESLLASDPIEVGSSSNSSAAYEYCIPFQKDLLLFSEKYQALVPGSNQAITPSNANVVITSTYEADMNASPVPLGRTVIFPAPRSRDFYGMKEMVPSQYTDSQYVSDDVTAHLPKYLTGRCRFGVSSSVANIACFASTSDPKVLYVHEYLWTNTEKAQQAWHRWTFPYDIADAFFSGSEINLMFVNNGHLVVGTMDPRIGSLTTTSERRPFLDLFVSATVVNNSVAIPAELLALDPSISQRLRLSDVDMALMGEEVGIADDGRLPTSLVTVPSFGDGDVTVGVPYRSSFSPTPPMVKDANGVVISSNKLSILRYMVGTANSYEYEAVVRDASVEGDDDEQQMPALYWGSAELDLGNARVNTESTAILPCRTAAATTTMMLYTDGLGEMNIISIEYVCRYNQKLRRR